MSAPMRNLAKAIEDGPRLRFDYETWITARGNGKVLLNGLGAMGCGSMWVTETDSHREHEGYAEAPVDPSVRDGFGETAFSQ